MIIEKSWFLILKPTILEFKEAEVLEGTELNLYFPENFVTSINGHVKLAKTKQQYRDFSQHSTKLNYKYVSYCLENNNFFKKRKKC